jgi:hypothetical protein
MSWTQTTATTSNHEEIDISGDLYNLVEQIELERVRMGLTMYAIERLSGRTKDSYRTMREYTHKPIAENFIGFAFALGFKIEIIGGLVPSFIYDSSNLGSTVVSHIVASIEQKRKSIDCSMMTMERAAGIAPRNWAKTVNGKFRPTLFKLLSIFHSMGFELRIVK